MRPIKELAFPGWNRPERPALSVAELSWPIKQSACNARFMGVIYSR
jgi:hypothetical protein